MAMIGSHVYLEITHGILGHARPNLAEVQALEGEGLFVEDGGGIVLAGRWMLGSRSNGWSVGGGQFWNFCPLKPYRYSPKASPLSPRPTPILCFILPASAAKGEMIVL